MIRIPSKKQAILAASFGTSVPEAERSCIRPVEDALRATFPDWMVFRAFTSHTIAGRQHVEHVEEALARLKAEGYDRIVIASMNIIPGIEYDRLLSIAEGNPVSEPLLYSEDDLQWMTMLLAEAAAKENHPLLLMGHGTDHSADAMYVRLRERLPENVYLACVKGAHSLERQLPILETRSDRSITLAPLMLVAGRHACSDMAGEGNHSWKSILESRGFAVTLRMQGLGAMKEVQQRFVKKLQQIIE